jgi:hypothetical protein
VCVCVGGGGGGGGGGQMMVEGSYMGVMGSDIHRWSWFQISRFLQDMKSLS